MAKWGPRPTCSRSAQCSTKCSPASSRSPRRRRALRLPPYLSVRYSRIRASPTICGRCSRKPSSKKTEHRQRTIEEFRSEIEEAVSHGEASGQEAIQGLRIVVPKLPLLPQLTPAPFSPSSTHLRVARDAATMAAPAMGRASDTDETPLVTTSSGLIELPKRRVPAWLLAAGAALSIALVGVAAWSHDSSAPEAATPLALPPESAPVAAPSPAARTAAPIPVAAAPIASAALPASSARAATKPQAKKLVGVNPGF